MNKITKTRVGDEINYLVNGVEGSGKVVKMSNSYVTVYKSGKYEDIPLNDTFFVKDIIINKTWDSMDDSERLETLSNRKQNSCCGSNDSPHFFTTKRGHWERHVNQHVMRGDIYADDDMDFKL